jgi:transposase
MAKPYSYDLRKKVIEAIEQDGLKKMKQVFCSTSVATP